MVLVNLLISCGFEQRLKKLIKRPFEALFHLNSNLCAPFILGLAGGYPQGALAICRIYDKGGCTKKEAERALCFCNNCGAAFLISGIGSMTGDIGFGALLYCLQVGVSMLYGIITRPKSVQAVPEEIREGRFSLDLITRAVTDSVTPMLNICAFTLCFALLCDIFGLLPISACPKAVFYSLLEITNASFFIAENNLFIPLFGLCVGWSGFCVHMQCHSVISGRFSMKPYLSAKAVQALTLFLILYLKNLRL